MAFTQNTARGAFAITASANTLTKPTDAIYCGDGGTVTVLTAKGETTTFTNVIAGSILPISVTKVTVGTGVIGLTA